MKIKLTYSLREMHVSRETDLPAHFDGVNGTEFDGVNCTEYFLWMREVEHQGQPVRQLCCDILCDVDPPPRAKETLLALKENRLLLDDPIQEGLPQTALSEGTIVDLQGKIKPKWIVDFDLLPKGAKPWFSQITTHLSNQLSNFVKQLRWVQNTAGGHKPFSSIGVFWSLDGEEWNRFPSAISSSMQLLRPIVVSEVARVKMAAIVNNRTYEPIAHDLMREAVELVDRTPRSALLVAFAALETGVKRQLKRMIPDASGLIDEMPSPPLLKITQDILPNTIKAKGISSGHFPLNYNAKVYLQKWLSQRNQVTHGTKHSINAVDLKEFIRFAKDILYLLDHLNGHDWALDHLESEVWVIDVSQQ